MLYGGVGGGCYPGPGVIHRHCGRRHLLGWDDGAVCHQFVVDRPVGEIRTQLIRIRRKNNTKAAVVREVSTVSPDNITKLVKALWDVGPGVPQGLVLSHGRF